MVMYDIFLISLHYTIKNDYIWKFPKMNTPEFRKPMEPLVAEVPGVETTARATPGMPGMPETWLRGMRGSLARDEKTWEKYGKTWKNHENSLTFSF